MSEMHEDQILSKLAKYTVGILRQIQNDKGQRQLVSCGSGVLVEVGGIKGIITAAHAIRKLKTSPVGALFTITDEKGKAPPLEFLISELEEVHIGDDEHPDGPDVGFFRVPYKIGETLISRNLFYNFDVRLKYSASPDDTPLDMEVLCGIVAEKSELKAITDTSRIDTHTMVLAYGTSSNFREGREGFDLFDFEIAHNDEVTRPKSYAGLSGSALWKFGGVDAAKDRLVFGIAFYQGAADAQGARVITCHGPKGIYNRLSDRIRDRFSAIFVDPA